TRVRGVPWRESGGDRQGSSVGACRYPERRSRSDFLGAAERRSEARDAVLRAASGAGEVADRDVLAGIAVRGAPLELLARSWKPRRITRGALRAAEEPSPVRQFHYAGARHVASVLGGVALHHDPVAGLQVRLLPS